MGGGDLTLSRLIIHHKLQNVRIPKHAKDSSHYPIAKLLSPLLHLISEPSHVHSVATSDLGHDW